MSVLAEAPVGIGFVVGAALAFGLVIGSFLNVVIHRVPRGESVVQPRSRCPDCGHAIRALENLPVLSWLVLRGRCRGCGAAISVRYPLVELVTGLLFALIAYEGGLAWMTLLHMGFAAALVAAAGIDFDHQIIPDEISLGGLAIGLVLVPLAAWLDGAAYSGALLHSLIGAGIGGGLLWVVGFGHARVSVALGREFPHWPGEGEALPRPSELDYWVWFPGLGFGDVKLMAMIGAFLGPFGVVQTIFAAALVGLLLGLGWVLVKRDWASPFGFAPAIAIGALAILVVPQGLLRLG